MKREWNNHWIWQMYKMERAGREIQGENITSFNNYVKKLNVRVQIVHFFIIYNITIMA